MANDNKISMVIPCFNEERGLPVLLSEKISEYITEVIVVDNCSTDNSVQVAQRYSAKVIKEEIKGYGSALLKGIYYAIGNTVVVLDGDGTYSIQDLKETLTFMENNHLDFISGCRFPLTNPKAMPFINKLSNYFISWLIGVLFKVHIKDSQSGFMIFKKHLLDKIKIENKGMGFSQEIKIKAWLLDCTRYAEVHIHYDPRIGKSKFRKISDSLGNLFALIHLYIRIKKAQ